MLVHDDDQDECRVIKQYERRAVSTHVFCALYAHWIFKLSQKIANGALDEEVMSKQKKRKAANK